MNKIIEEQIMKQREHKFIYSNNTNNRSNDLKKMISKFPINIKSEKTMGIYVPKIGIPLDSREEHIMCPEMIYKINYIAREYLNYLIEYNLIKNIIDNKEVINKIEFSLLNVINSAYFNRLFVINDINTYLYEIELILNMLIDVYDKVLETGMLHELVNYIPHKFISIEWLCDILKKLLITDEPFTLILDNKTKVSLASLRAVMDLLSIKTSSLCIKIATSRESWKTYKTSNGKVKRLSHIELDDNYNKFIHKK